MNLFTIGYEGLSFDSFVKYLKNLHIAIVFDVRKNPVSRKKGFSKLKLNEGLILSKIQYVHLSELGTPKLLRDELRRKKDYLEFFQKYNIVLNKRLQYLDVILDTLKNENVALMCFEKDPFKCHRSAIALKIKERSNNGIVIRNIKTS
jgi:uncharacterized protein (DUF488 family)